MLPLVSQLRTCEDKIVWEIDSLQVTSLTSDVTFTSYTRGKCNLRCKCSCHLRYGARISPVANALLGQIFVGYMGLPVLASGCSTASCASSSAKSVQITYTFPTWFIHRTIDITLGSNYFGEPELNLRIRNRREYSSEHSMFQLARSGDIKSMRYRLSHRLASPNDVSTRGGSTAFDVSPRFARFCYGTPLRVVSNKYSGRYSVQL